MGIGIGRADGVVGFEYRLPAGEISSDAKVYTKGSATR